MKVDDRVKVLNGPLAGGVGVLEQIIPASQEGEYDQHMVYISGIVNSQPVQGTYVFKPEDLEVVA